MQLNAKIAAGSVPRSAKNPTQAAYLAATEAFDTDRLHMLTSMNETTVFYFAASSRELTNGVTSTALAAALPGHPAHQGDGCYVAYHGTDAALAIKDGDSLSFMCNSIEAIQATLASQDLPIYDIDVLKAEPWKLESQAGLSRREGDKWANKIQKISSVWAAVASLAAGGLLVATGINDKTSELHAQQAQLLVSQLTLAQPIASDLADLHKVNSIVIRASGWIQSYKKEAGKVTYVLRLPRWVAKSTIDELGPDIHTEYDPVADNIFASKGDVRKPSDRVK
jgi:hypothetical protein